MALTKATYSMIDGAVADVLDYGAVGNGVADDTAAIQAAFDAVGVNGEVYFPAGTYKTSAGINATCSFYGDGSGTTFKPSGGHEVFAVKTGRADFNYAERIGSFVIDFTHLPSITSADVGLWLCKGSATSVLGVNHTTFSNIFINRGYRAIQMLNTDLGNLWTVKFENMILFGLSDHGIYIDTTGSNGSLNVTFDTITIDGGSNPTSKGAFIRGIGQCRYSGVSTALTGGNGSCFTMSDCSLVDARVQIEGTVVSSQISGLVAFTNCPTVEVSVVSQTCTFNQGVGNMAAYIYADDNVKTLTVRALTNLSDVYTSGTTYKVNASFGAGTTQRLCILDQNIAPADVLASTTVIAATLWPTTNYALQKTDTTRRVQALDVAVPVATTTNLISVADYAGRPYQVAGLYLVQGTWNGNINEGFTDLVLVTGVGQTVAQTAVVVSSNTIGGGSARTYSVASSFLRIAVAHPSGNFIVSATGIDQAGAAV